MRARQSSDVGGLHKPVAARWKVLRQVLSYCDSVSYANSEPKMHLARLINYAE